MQVGIEPLLLSAAQSFERHRTAKQFVANAARLQDGTVWQQFIYNSADVCVQNLPPRPSLFYFLLADSVFFRSRADGAPVADCRGERVRRIIRLRYALE
ncbi:hypothetical protein SDC9_150890 [bioreactor metagenome]|uniref:Uncharacterized protein n=1 Tax=bioreactor metagenome TaxID=1076179 RepID=A0A645ENR3_9ZZZZ